MFPSKVMFCFVSVSMLLRIVSCSSTPEKPQHCAKSSGNEMGAKVRGCDPNQALLKVYMYDLPLEFHFGLLHWKGQPNQTWPDLTSKAPIPSYPGGLTLQHSVEYWLTLDLLSSSTSSDIARPCIAIRVMDSSQADVIYVPFFSSLSYNRCGKVDRGSRDKSSCADRALQRKLVSFLRGRDEWRTRSGEDHLIVAHHPNSMMEVRAELSSAMFVLADFGRYPPEVANIDKDIIAPYKHILQPSTESAPFDKRPTLLYFQGAIRRKDGGAIRQQLYNLLKDEPGVHFKFGTARGKGVRDAAQGMAKSKFCLSIAGDTPSSNRLFDAIASQCVPVIISDQIGLPFEDRLDYRELSLVVRAEDALKKGHLVNVVRGVKAWEWEKMRERLKEVERHFEYEFPSRPGDAVEMIWREVWNKMRSRRLERHRRNRRWFTAKQ